MGRFLCRFYRILGTHTAGSGLGLAIVREIATYHDMPEPFARALHRLGARRRCT